MAELNEKQKRFCEEYIKSGNATKSYMDSYGTENENTAAVNAVRLLRNAKVAKYLQSYEEKLDKSRIASVEEVQQWWTRLYCGEESADIKDRLKASELLVKSRGGFIDRLNISADEKTEINIKFGDKSKRREGTETDPLIIDGGALKDENSD